MQFKTPLFFILLIVLPLLGGYWWWMRRGKRVIVPVRMNFSDIGAMQQLPKTAAVKALPLLKVLRLSVIALLICALAQPQLSQSREQKFYEGIDILLVLDISESMRAEDFQGANRIQAAKTVITDFLENRKNDRIGLVVFSGESFTLCPLTLDYPVLTELLREVKIGQLTDGTAIGDAILTATQRLRASEAKSKIVILLTDGENNAGTIQPNAAAEMAAAFGIKVYTIGMGKAGGALIPYEDTTFGKRYREVLTYLDEDTLKHIADMTRGRYFRATDMQSLTNVYAEIDRFEKTKFEVVTSVDYKELAPYFLIPAVLLLGLEILLSNTVLRKIP